MLESENSESLLKICTMCRKIKSVSQFYLRKSGSRKGTYFSRCISCSIDAVLRSRNNNPEAKIKLRDTMRKWRENNKEISISRERERYRANPQKKRNEAQKARMKNPQRERAHQVVRHAIDSGKFPPAWTMVCDICQETQALNWHHHKGYSEEFILDVIAICDSCHGKEHRI